jgi:hypothetical protein
MSSSFALLLLAAGTAAAQPYAMSGEWYMNRGPLVDIPINGGPALCFDAGGFESHNGCHDIGAVGFVPAAGGIPQTVAASVTPMGADPASFTVPPMIFGQNVGKQSVAVPVALPTVLQLATSFNLMGPITSCPVGVGPPTFGCPAGQIALTRNFREDAWTMQVGRAALSFSFCPGVVGACTTPVPSLNGAMSPSDFNGRVAYSNPGGNGFGGTMAMTITTTGNNSHVSVAIDGPGAALSFVLHNPVAGMGSQAQGRGYAVSDTAYLPPGPIHTTFGVGTPCTNALPPLPAGCGLITMQGAQLTTGGTPMNPVYGPADTNTNIGMPWTTGTVTASNIETLLSNPGTTIITGMGEDDRVGGIGTITMVSGGITHRVTSGQHFAAIDAVTLSFGDKTPSMSPTGFAVAAVLMVLAVGYAFRRRL